MQLKGENMVGKIELWKDKIEFDGREFQTSDLNDRARNLLGNLAKLNSLSNEKARMIAILKKAKKAYISDLKNEMLSAKSGFDFSD